MIVIKKPRNNGKTTELVGMLLKDPNTLLAVHSRQEVARIIRDYRLHKIDRIGDRVITYDQVSNSRTVGRHVLIDNVDEFVQRMFDYRVMAISINED